MAAGYQNFLICLEMFFAAIALKYAFPISVSSIVIVMVVIMLMIKFRCTWELDAQRRQTLAEVLQCSPFPLL